MADYLVKFWNRETHFFHSEYKVAVEDSRDAVNAARKEFVKAINPNGAPGYENHADPFAASVHDAVTGAAVDVIDESRATDSEVAVLRARVDAFEKEAETRLAAAEAALENDFRSQFPATPPPPVEPDPPVDHGGTASE
jgi:hypothetical protein